MPNARHRSLLRVILGETLEQKRFFEQAVAGRTDLLGRRADGAGTGGGVLPVRWIERDARAWTRFSQVSIEHTNILSIGLTSPSLSARTWATGGGAGFRGRTPRRPFLRPRSFPNYIETEPEGEGLQDQPLYLNAVAVGETDLAAREILDRLLAIERAYGRERPYPGAAAHARSRSRFFSAMRSRLRPASTFLTHAFASASSSSARSPRSRRTYRPGDKAEGVGVAAQSAQR